MKRIEIGKDLLTITARKQLDSREISQEEYQMSGHVWLHVTQDVDQKVHDELKVMKRIKIYKLEQAPGVPLQVSRQVQGQIKLYVARRLDLQIWREVTRPVSYLVEVELRETR